MLLPHEREFGGDDKQGAGDGDQRASAPLLRSLCVRELEHKTWFAKGQANLFPGRNTLKQRQQV